MRLSEKQIKYQFQCIEEFSRDVDDAKAATAFSYIVELLEDIYEKLNADTKENT